MDFAANSIPVFPCVEDGKAPACPNGLYDATTDVEKINGWWQQNPNYNLALCPENAGWLVLDADPGAELGSLDLPPTYEVESPRGGSHLYYSGSARSSVQTLAPHLDTRGRGGYVLVPPSRVGGKAYRVRHARPIGPVPQWCLDNLERSDQRVAAAIADADLPANVDRGRNLLLDYVRRNHVSIEGQGGDNRLYEVACELLNLGLSPDTALLLLEETWNPHCLPPWSDAELRSKIDNASRYAQNEPGAWAVAPAAETFDRAILDRIASEAKTQEPRSRFHPDDESEMESAPEPKWIVPGLLPEAATVLWFGPTGSFKSFLVQDVLMSVSCGVETFGLAPLLTGPVFYAALEGRNAIKKTRRLAWKVARSVDALPAFYVMRAPMVSSQEEIQEFGDQITKRLAGRKPALIAIDTVSKSMMGLNENDAGDAGRFIKFCDSLVEHFGCTVIAVGHTGKDGERGHRGSSAFPAGFDTQIETKATRATKAVEVWARQHKDAPEPTEPWLFEGKEVGQSLVFSLTEAENYKTLVGKNDAVSPRIVGKALQELNAYGTEQSVSTTVLASALDTPIEKEPEEQREARVARLVRSLRAMAKGKLEAYVTRAGSELHWFLPGKAV